MLLRKSDISRKVQVLAFFVNNERNFCRKLSFCSGRVKNSTPVVFLIWGTCFGGLHFITELPDVSAAWENRSIVTLMVNSRNHFDRSFWSGDIFMLTMWLCSAGNAEMEFLKNLVKNEQLLQNVYTGWASRERWKNSASGGFSSISWWTFFHWLFPSRKLLINRTYTRCSKKYLAFGKFTRLTVRKFLLTRLQSAVRT